MRRPSVSRVRENRTHGWKGGCWKRAVRHRASVLPMNILLVRLSALGDVVLTLPTLAALAEARPDVRIGWAVQESFAPLLEGHPLLSRVHAAPRRWWLGQWQSDPEVRRRSAAFVAGMREANYDLAIDLAGILKSALVLRASRAKERWGSRTAREGSWLFYTRRLYVNPGAHAVHRFRSLLADLLPAGMPGTVRFPLPEWPEAAAAVASRLKQAGLAGRPWVLLHPGAGKEANRWPVEHWAALAARLRERGLVVVVTGLAHEREDNARVASAATALDLTGSLGLRELAALCKRAALVVAGDTGPLHLAGAVGTPVVGIFGAADPSYTGPWGPSAWVVSIPVPCGPCRAKRCPIGTHDCLARLAPERVWAAVEATLAAAEVGA